MQFTSQASDSGISERQFSLGAITGVLWQPLDASGPRPLVLMSHGGGQHKHAPGIVARARLYADAFGAAVAAIDAPGHGDRPKSEADHRFTATIMEKMAAGESVAEDIARGNASRARTAVPEWREVLDALQQLDSVGRGGPVGFWGLSMGGAIGVPLVASEPRISCAVLGLVGIDGLDREAHAISVPLEFLMQWDDELIPREAALSLFDAFGSTEKSLHANRGAHVAVPRFEVESSARFFSRHLSERR